MTGVPGAAEDAAAIHAAFAEPVLYNGAGLIDAVLSAVKSDSAADMFQGPGDTLREIKFEILQSALPERPGKGDTIREADETLWRVNDVTRRDDIDAWVLIVETAA